jgi:hypothetical protein
VQALEQRKDEMSMRLYEQMARTAVAWNNCIKTNNTEWRDKHSETFKNLLDLLPHGSGIDSSWNVELENCGDDKLVFFCGYHHMNENGMYDGWTEFTVTVTPSLMFGCRVKITGPFPRKYAETRDYLQETIDFALTREIDEKGRLAYV